MFDSPGVALSEAKHALVFAATPLLRTKVPSEGNVQFEAWLPREAGQDVPTFGLVLHAGQAVARDGRPSGYLFLLAPVGKQALLQVCRNGVKLREARVGVSDGPLHLLARQEGDRLLFQVNDRVPVEVHDLFPLRAPRGGVFALHAPGGVVLQRLLASRQTQPVRPSPLEKGDEAFARGAFAEALEQYRAQALPAAGEDRRECRYKEGVCLARLRRDREAARLFQQVADQTEGAAARWRLAALCQLWLIEARAGRGEDADAVLRTLASHARFAELAAHVPEDVRTEMFEAYYPKGTYDLLRHNPHRVRNLERALEVQTLLGAAAEKQTRIRERLLEAYQFEDRVDRAVAVAEELLRQPGLRPSRRADVLDELVWLLLRKGQSSRALDEVNRHLLCETAGPTGHYRREYLPLLVSRARIYAGQRRWRESAEDLEALLRLSPVTGTSCPLDACLLLGFVREQQGNAAGALEAWRRGLRLARQLKALHVLPAAIMASLSGEMTREDAEAMVAGVLGEIGDRSPVMMLVRSKLFPFDELEKALRATWRSPRGREYARRIALRDVSHEEMLSVQAILGAYEGCRLGAFPGELTAEEDALLWRLFNDIYRSQARGEMTQGHIVSILAAWNGATGAFGWGGLAEKLPKRLKGPLAHVFGRRSLQLKRQADALMYFRLVKAEAAQDSPLWRLAESELKKLGEQPGEGK
jgi:tetratricopeptide (TPR) repeat protein